MRKLGLLTTLWTALLFFPLTSFALGLGEIEVDSFLNQPLKAEIEVLSARPGEIDDLLVSLASREAFRKAGLQRSSNLSKLRFKVEKSEDGQSALILITTKTPVKEPFLNFLVEADWAKGRLLREFTVLLDPPYFAQQAEATATPASSTSEPALESAPTIPAETPMTRADDPTIPAESETQQFQGEPLSQPIALVEEPDAPEDSTPYSSDISTPVERMGGNEVLVEKGDTLWSIASRFKDGEHSMGQIMLAMQAMNPDAFGQDNINNLKVGSILRAPDMDALDRLSKQEAYARVLEQNGLWDEYVARKSGATGAGSPESSTLGSSAEQQPTEDGQLSLLAPGDGESTSASLQSDANSEDAGQIRKQLAFAEEELEAAKLENDDLKSRVADLEQQLAKFEELQKLIQIEDSSLAQLQSNTAETEVEPQAEGFREDSVQEGVTAETEETSEQPTDVMKAAADQMMSESSADQMESEAPADDMSSDAGTDEKSVAEADSMLPDDEGELSSDAKIASGEQELSDEMTAVEGPQQDEQEKQAEFVPAPVIVTEAPSTDLGGGVLDMLPSLDSILADPIMLGGIGAILALLLGLVFLKRKKSEKDEESGLLLDEGDDLMDDDATPIHIPSVEDAQENIDEDLAALDTEQHMADTLSVEAEEIPDALEDEFSSTQIISADEKPAPEESSAVAQEQDDVLNEVDVYLAYGLYDNAEDLLKESLQESPDRADYRAKLLDTYFATKNASGFIQEAEALKSLGGAADRYWDRVQIMGFELAPDNELFADARNSELSVADLEYEKPESPDFDIGAEDDITDFSNTDFDLLADTDSDNFDVTSDLLGDVDKEVTDTETIAPLGVTTENLDDSDEDIQLPDISDDEETLLREEEVSETDNLELPDQIGDFDLGLDDEDTNDEVQPDEDALNFNLPDDLDLSTDEDERLVTSDLTEQVDHLEDISEIDVEPDIDPADVSEINLEEDDVAEKVADRKTENKNLDDGLDLDLDIDTEPDEQADSDSDSTVEGTRHLESALDMDMSDLDSADLNTGTFKVSDDSSRDEITEFGPADITGEYSGYDELQDSVEDVDVSAGLEKTGTYAPGDFNEDDIDGLEVSIEDTDDIEDLMLPDDVDEVGTKLDLAKAFIDMGDAEGARSSLEEVMSEGTVEQQAEATDLMEKIK